MEERTLIHYWFVIYRRRRAFLVTLGSAVFVALVLSLALPKVYEARAAFFVPAIASRERVSFTSADPASGFTQSPLYPAPEREMGALYIGILKSRSLRERVSADFPERSSSSIARNVDFALSPQYYLEVYARDRDPEIAALIANAYTQHFNEFQRQASLGRLNAARRALQTQVEEVSRLLVEAQAEREAFLEKNELVSIDLEAGALTQGKIAAESDLNAAVTALREVEAKLQSSGTLIDGSDALPQSSAAARDSSVVRDLKIRVADLESQLARLKTELGPGHPSLIAAQSQYDEARRTLDSETRTMLRAEREYLGAYIDKLRQSIADLNRRLSSMPGLDREFSQVDERVNRYQALLDNLMAKLAEASTQERWESESAVMVDPAIPPTSPAYPILWLNLIIAGALGGIGGVIYAFFIEYLGELERERAASAVEP